MTANRVRALDHTLGCRRARARADAGEPRDRHRVTGTGRSQQRPAPAITRAMSAYAAAISTTRIASGSAARRSRPDRHGFEVARRARTVVVPRWSGLDVVLRRRRPIVRDHRRAEALRLDAQALRRRQSSSPSAPNASPPSAQRRRRPGCAPSARHVDWPRRSRRRHLGHQPEAGVGPARQAGRGRRCRPRRPRGPGRGGRGAARSATHLSISRRGWSEANITLSGPRVRM